MTNTVSREEWQAFAVLKDCWNKIWETEGGKSTEALRPDSALNCGIGQGDSLPPSEYAFNDDPLGTKSHQELQILSDKRVALEAASPLFRPAEHSPDVELLTGQSSDFEAGSQWTMWTFYAACVRALSYQKQRLDSEDDTWSEIHNSRLSEHLSRLVLWGDGLEGETLQACLSTTMALRKNVFQLLRDLRATIVREHRSLDYRSGPSTWIVENTEEQMLSSMQAAAFEHDDDDEDETSSQSSDPSDTYLGSHSSPHERYLDDVGTIIACLADMSPTLELLSEAGETYSPRREVLALPSQTGHISDHPFEATRKGTDSEEDSEEDMSQCRHPARYVKRNSAAGNSHHTAKALLPERPASNLALPGESPSLSRLRHPASQGQEKPSQNTGHSKGKISFAVSAPAARAPDAEEYDVMSRFARHASRCVQCVDPVEAYRSNGALCESGTKYAREVAQFMYSKNGRPYSVVDRQQWDERIQIVVPAKMAVIKKLCKAVDEGLTLKRESETRIVTPSVRSGRGAEREQRGDEYRHEYIPRDEPRRRDRRGKTENGKGSPYVKGRGSVYEEDEAERRQRSEDQPIIVDVKPRGRYNR